MIDRKKVIEGLEHCIRKPRNSHDNPCDGCPYDKKKNFECGKLMVDALELLKEQEPLVIRKDFDFNDTRGGDKRMDDKQKIRQLKNKILDKERKIDDLLSMLKSFADENKKLKEAILTLLNEDNGREGTEGEVG